MLDPNMELHFVDSYSELQEFYEWLGRKTRPVMGLDTETTGLSIFNTTDLTSQGGEPPFRCRMIQVGDTTAGWAFPTDPYKDWSGPVLEFFESYQGIWAVHNLAYDAKVFRRCYGVHLPQERTHDTMIMSQILRPDKSAALKSVTKELIDPMAATAQDMLENGRKQNGWEWWNIPYDFQPYTMYSALDPVLTVELWKALRADLKEPEAFDLEMSTLFTAIDAEYRGIRVDVEYSEKKKNELLEYVDRSNKWAKENLGININSSGALAKWMSQNGQELTEYTATGAYKMDKEVLKYIAKNGNPTTAPIAKFVQNVKYQTKMANTYLHNFIYFSNDGVLHPQIKTYGAQTTGRMSITDPALQTLPKGDKIIRRAILPDEGHLFSSADQDQMEFRLFSILSEDQHLIDLFNNADKVGGDAFTDIGKRLYEDPNFNKSDSRRGLVKSSIYGRLFGAGVKKQSETAGVTLETMQKISDDMEEMYPGFISLPKKLQHDAKANGGFVETMFTNKHIPIPEDKIYRATNYLIQGSGSEVLKIGLNRLAKAGYSEFFRLPIHDELLFSTPPDMVDEICHALGECMSFLDLSVPLRAAGELKGDCWSGWIDKQSSL